MNIAKIISLLSRQRPTEQLRDFIDGAAVSNATLITADPIPLAESLPGRYVVELSEIGKLPDDEEVLFDTSAMLAIIAHVSDTPIVHVPVKMKPRYTIVNTLAAQGEEEKPKDDFKELTERLKQHAVESKHFEM